MSINKKFFVIIICLFAVANAMGQAARSPFSTFGIGEFYGNQLANNQGMAGIGVSQPQYWYLNNQNPALLVYNQLTVFQVGILGERRNISSDTESEKTTGGNLNYIATAFPIKPNKWTTSLGLMPYTSVKYRYQYEGEVINNPGEKTIETEQGSGGISQLYWSNGVRLNKDFSVGLKAAYLFSSIVNTYKNQLASSSQPINFILAKEEKSNVKDFAFSAGVSWSRDSLFTKKKFRLSAGLVYDFATDLKTKRLDKFYRTNILGDTLDNTTEVQRGNISVPAGITAGLSLTRGGRWTVSSEFSYRDWATFSSINNDDESLGSSWRVALGGEITPDTYSEKYLKRITYRTGISLEQYPYMPNGRYVTDRGINFGLSLPAGRSSLDLAFRYGKRGDKQSTILEENYFKVYFGITFNDQWFIKRKFD